MNRLTPRKFVWQICVALLLILLNALPAASQDKTRQGSHLQRRLYDYGTAVIGSEGLGCV